MRHHDYVLNVGAYMRRSSSRSVDGNGLPASNVDGNGNGLLAEHYPHPRGGDRVRGGQQWFNHLVVETFHHVSEAVFFAEMDLGYIGTPQSLAACRGSVEADAAEIRLVCSTSPCFQPGAEVTVVVGSTVRLPFVPDVLAGAVSAQIPVGATHVSVVDRYRAL